MLAAASGELSLDTSQEPDWRAGAADFTLSDALDTVDLTAHLDDPENLLILHFYKAFFGFTPLSYAYLAIWPAAYKACALSNVIATAPVLMAQIGKQAMDGVTYAASAAQGCTYCMVHTTAKDGIEQTHAIQSLRRARAGEPGPGNPLASPSSVQAGFSSLSLRILETRWGHCVALTQRIPGCSRQLRQALRGARGRDGRAGRASHPQCGLW